MTVYKTLSRIFLSFLAIMMMSEVVYVSAQQVVMGRAMIAGGGGGDESKQMKAALDREIRQIKAIQEQRMTTSIEDMKRVCKLSDEQVTKLQVAAKGAIERSLESTRKQYTEMLKQFGMLNVVAADAVEEAAEESGETDGENAAAEQTDADDAEEEEELAEGAWQVAGGIDLGFVRQNIEINGGKLALPEMEKIWTNTVSKTLTEPQASKYAETVTARTARVRQAAVEAFVAKVDAELLLQDSQRDELVKLVNEKYGEALQKNMLRPDRRDFFVMNDSTSSKINKDVRKLFSDSQFHIWKSKFAGELEQIAAMNGQRIGNNGGVWQMLFGN